MINHFFLGFQERLKISVNLPDTPEPGPIENKNKSVVIQKKPKVRYLCYLSMISKYHLQHVLCLFSCFQCSLLCSPCHPQNQTSNQNRRYQVVSLRLVRKKRVSRIRFRPLPKLLTRNKGRCSNNPTLPHLISHQCRILQYESCGIGPVNK